MSGWCLSRTRPAAVITSMKKMLLTAAVTAAVLAPAMPAHAGSALDATYVMVNANYTQCDLTVGTATVQRGDWLAQPYLNDDFVYWSAMEVSATSGVATSVRLVLANCVNPARNGLVVQINTRKGLVRAADGWTLDGTSPALHASQVGSPSTDPAVQDLYFKVTA